MRTARLLSGAAVLALLLGPGVLPGSASAEGSAAAPQQSEVERFCGNIADAARDRRYAIQADELKKLQDEIDGRIAALEKKRGEYEDWMKRREAFLAQARDDVVSIYRTMKPDAAAERLAQLRIDMAASILMKLEPKRAGTILNEMETKRAAELTGVMVNFAREKDPS
jgi:flagellar motility protein MotE (MotC chaperone)